MAISTKRTALGFQKPSHSHAALPLSRCAWAPDARHRRCAPYVNLDLSNFFRKLTEAENAPAEATQAAAIKSWVFMVIRTMF